MTGDRLRNVFLACGPLSALVYIGWHELAALQWEGYSRISNAISELHLTGAPSKWLLDPWEGLVYNALVIAFGIGVWRSAEGSRALRTVGGLQILSGATGHRRPTQPFSSWASDSALCAGMATTSSGTRVCSTLHSVHRPIAGTATRAALSTCLVQRT